MTSGPVLPLVPRVSCMSRSVVVDFLAEPYREQRIPSLLPEEAGEEGFLVAAIPRGYSRGNLAPNVSNVLIGDEGNERRLQWNLY
ncbi:hypothetical protein TRIUR3_32703 [Triticum urartu]|uniref:Uncharacterized protein n=1 Tax=Triticum urartu TaxID=4572 RepID=M7Z344_TRIUA|nr:hypothetical protein TRIUR3_32703 [Triticum urartu]